MPKYILLGIGVTLVLFFGMHYWSKISDKSKNKIIMSIFGIIGIGFVLVLGLLLL